MRPGRVVCSVDVNPQVTRLKRANPVSGSVVVGRSSRTLPGSINIFAKI
jgi:hypothetical protein